MYALTAFLIRLSASSLLSAQSRSRFIAIGLISHAIGLFLLPLVSQPWHLLGPAFCSGFGHAVTFPCVVSLAISHFPEQHRGTANSITLGSYDLGIFLLSPLIGWTIDNYGFRILFSFSSLICLVTACLFIITTDISARSIINNKK